jgi:signal peptidase I
VSGEETHTDPPEVVAPDVTAPDDAEADASEAQASEDQAVGTSESGGDGRVTSDVVDETAAGKPKRSTTKSAIEWVLLIVAALVIALLVKTFLFQAFYIPSDSMVPTLKTNDRVIVNKLSYKLHDVHRGDVVVFTTPKGPDGKPIDPTIKDLVKRVIGLPGETVSEKNGHVLVDGKALDESYLPSGTVTDCASFEPQCFPTGALPADNYWVMGDNRAGSRDSRYFGPIEKGEIVGRVFLRIWPLNRIHIF